MSLYDIWLNPRRRTKPVLSAEEVMKLEEKEKLNIPKGKQIE